MCRLQMLPILTGQKFSCLLTLPKDIFLHWSKLKAFADDKINLT